jgi:hypothetical protein
MVSSFTGVGFTEFLVAVEAAGVEYETCVPSHVSSLVVSYFIVVAF